MNFANMTVVEILEVGSLIASAVAAFVALSVKAAVADLRREIGEQRACDKEELRRWINGSFMRSPEVLAHLEGLDKRLNRVEQEQ